MTFIKKRELQRPFWKFYYFKLRPEQVILGRKNLYEVVFVSFKKVVGFKDNQLKLFPYFCLKSGYSVLSLKGRFWQMQE